MTEEVKQDLTPEQIAEVEAKRKRERETQEVFRKINFFADVVLKDLRRKTHEFDDLSNPEVYSAHSQLLVYIANKVCLAPQHREFEIDDNNRQVLRFLLYYFNNCAEAENVFPDKHYKLHNNLLIMGNVGTGKTMLMQIFSEYLRVTKNPNFFYNVSVTQMTNYFTIHNNIDRYTFNEDEGGGFNGKPFNICLNDIGVENRPFYGIDTRTVVEDFLHARNEIWTQTAIDRRKFAHLTTNLTMKQLKETFSDDFGRLIDRFKTYNIIKLTGESRR